MYVVPDGIDAPVVGARVVVPLGSRVVTGIVIEVGSTNPESRVANPESRPSTSSGRPEPVEGRVRNPKSRIPNPDRVRPIRQVLDATAFVPPDVVDLARWTAEYYAAGVGDTIPALLPP